MRSRGLGRRSGLHQGSGEGRDKGPAYYETSGGAPCGGGGAPCGQVTLVTLITFNVISGPQVIHSQVMGVGGVGRTVPSLHCAPAIMGEQPVRGGRGKRT